ncbi:lycopene cyclase domain-containing protein [Microterricola viridarii]|uniref:Lycopene cyclase domain-containing protein n=1 Tax=Microterricola viridarii TaxID=412690 RepID=A0A1H1LQC0_9MICO|nr:lycopene cyclase domain-containing protein [Microterricola viridarii]SDR76245.1 lycopene cyclase domain-containing protein [Microterricola viridarii]
MTYTVLNLVMLAVVLLVAASALLLRRPARLGTALASAGVTAAALFVLTALFDSLMIAGGLMEYSGEHLLGWSIGLAPIEDFAYPLAAVILLPSLWALLGPARRPVTVKESADVG